MGAVSFAKLVQDDPLKRVAMYAYRPISEKVRNSRPMMPGVLPTHFAAGCRGNRAKAGLLTCPTLRAFPSEGGQWPVWRATSLAETGFTAAGTVADLHGIPF